MNDSVESITLDLEQILDRIAKLDHPNSLKTITQIQEGIGWIQEEKVAE